MSLSDEKRLGRPGGQALLHSAKGTPKLGLFFQGQEVIWGSQEKGKGLTEAQNQGLRCPGFESSLWHKPAVNLGNGIPLSLSCGPCPWVWGS